MRTVELAPGLAERIREAGRTGYPDEVCGFLLASEQELEGPRRVVRDLQPAPNTFAGERRRRFVIAPEELRAAERRASDRGQAVAGFYHSHPDHPALPSAFDQEHAWPWYTYLVLSVDRRGAGELGAFELERSGERFLTCPLEGAEPSRAPEPTPVEPGR